MRYVPSEADMKKTIAMVEVTVEGDYIAILDEKRRTKKTYEIKLLVPQGFNKSDIKRLAPRQLMATKPDFVSLRTFFQKGTARPSKEKMKMGDLYSEREKERFKKLRAEIAKAGKLENDERDQTGDTSRYGDDGLPPVINE